MIQNVSNCHKSERSRNKNDSPYFIVVLVIIWGLSGLVWSFLGEKVRFIFFMFTERLELIKGRKQFHTAPYLRFDKFHHNKRIALQLQKCILGSYAYLCPFSWVRDPILSRRKSLLNTKLAFPGMRFHLKCTHESLRAAFRRQNCPQPGRGWVRLSTSNTTLRSPERSFDGNREILERPWNSLASLDLENHNFV